MDEVASIHSVITSGERRIAMKRISRQCYIFKRDNNNYDGDILVGPRGNGSTGKIKLGMNGL